MAVAKFCSMLGLAAMLVCLLVGTVACEPTKEESKAIRALFEKELESAEALKRLNTIEDKTFSFGEYKVRELLAIKDYKVGDCTVNILERFTGMVGYFYKKSVGLYNYVRKSQVRYGKLCAENYQKQFLEGKKLSENEKHELRLVAQRLGGEGGRSLLGHYQTKLSTQEEINARILACRRFDTETLLKERLAERGFRVVIDENWLKTLKGCKRLLETFRYKQVSGVSSSSSADSGLVMPSARV